MIEYDSKKDMINRQKHGISLIMAEKMRMDAIIQDKKRDYKETRYLAFGVIGGDPYCLSFTDRNGSLRAISLRRCHKKEYNRHVGKK